MIKINDGRNTVVRPSDCAVLKKGIVCYLAVKVVTLLVPVADEPM